MEKPAGTTLINICIIPSEAVSNSCAAISQGLEGDNTLFSLGGDKFAHMTTYMTRFADDNIEDVVKKVGELLESISSFQCEHTGYFMSEGRYLEVSYRKSLALVTLHELLIKNVASLRINPGRPYEEGYFTPYPPEQRQNAEETAYDLARTLYRPHVTLTRYKEGAVPREFPAFHAADLSFGLGKVCVHKADDNGAVHELIKEFQV